MSSFTPTPIFLKPSWICKTKRKLNDRCSRFRTIVFQGQGNRKEWREGAVTVSLPYLYISNLCRVPRLLWLCQVNLSNAHIHSLKTRGQSYGDTKYWFVAVHLPLQVPPGNCIEAMSSGEDMSGADEHSSAEGLYSTSSSWLPNQGGHERELPVFSLLSSKDILHTAFQPTKPHIPHWLNFPDAYFICFHNWAF